MKMLFLYLFLFSCSLSLSTESVTQEFLLNLKKLMTKEKASEIFLPVPYKIKGTNVHDCLNITMQQLEMLKEDFRENTEVKDCLIKMYQNVKHLKARIAKLDTKTAQKPCLIKEVALKTAERLYAQIFQKLHEYY